MTWHWPPAITAVGAVNETVKTGDIARAENEPVILRVVRVVPASGTRALGCRSEIPLIPAGLVAGSVQMRSWNEECDLESLRPRTALCATEVHVASLVDRCREPPAFTCQSAGRPPVARATQASRCS